MIDYYDEKSIEDDIYKVCDDLAKFLVEKNRSYSGSVFKPINIFSKLSSIDAINVRIDDKLKRLMDGKEYANEDTEYDLLGYLVLKQVLRRSKK